MLTRHERLQGAKEAFWNESSCKVLLIIESRYTPSLKYAKSMRNVQEARKNRYKTRDRRDRAE